MAKAKPTAMPRIRSINGGALERTSLTSGQLRGELGHLTRGYSMVRC